MTQTEQTLRIRVVSVADTAGFRETITAIEAVTKITQKDTAATQENAATKKNLGLRMTDVKAIAQDLGNQFPLLGAAMQFAFNPFVGAIHLVLMGYSALKEKIKEINDELDKQGEKAAEPTFLNAIRAREEAMEEGARKAEAFADHIANLIDAEQQYQKAIEDSIALMGEQAATQDRLAGAKLGVDVDLLKRQLADGLISQQEYYLQLADLEKKFEEEKLVRQKAAHEKETEAWKAELQHVQDNLKPDLEKAETARTAANNAKAKTDTRQAELPSLENLRACH